MTPNTLAIQALYVAYFNRPADPRGLEYWEGVVAAQGGSTAAVSVEFAKSAEYKDTYANMSNFDIVAQVYENLLGREGDLPGVNYWTDLLDAGTITIDNVVAAIAAGAKGSDLETVENRAAGAAKFTEALDTVDEIRAYGTEAGGAVGRSFLATINNDASLATATTAANLTAVTGQVVNSLPSTTTNLTAGIDNLPGTNGNDVFNAYATGVLANGDNATTLGSNDVIDGGAGADTLNIEATIDESEAATARNVTQTGTVRNVETINIINNNGALFGGEAGVDAAGFVGATAIWQKNAANVVNNLGATTTAGFDTVEGTDLEVNGAAGSATATIALNRVGGATDNVVTLNVAGEALNTVTVTGAIVKNSEPADGAPAAKLALNVVAGIDGSDKSLATVTVNTAVKTTLTVTESDDAAENTFVRTVNAAGSTGAVTFVGAASVASITGGTAGDTLTLGTAFASAVKTATVDGGAGDDTITVALTNADDVTGATASVLGGEGNDKITVKNNADLAAKVTVNAGVGDDVVTIQDAAGEARALSDNDNVVGGDGTDTIVVGANEATLDSGDYVRLQDLSGFERVRFSTELTDVDASELAKFTQIEFEVASSVVSVAATQAIVTKANLEVSTAGYDADASGDKNNSAAAANVSVVDGTEATVTVNAKSVNLTVDAAAAETSLATTLTGDLDSAVVTLTSGVEDDLDVVASLNVSAATFTSLTVKGTGSATVDNAEGKLATIDASGLAGTDVDGAAFDGLTYTGNVDVKETITLGAGNDALVISSVAGSTQLTKIDTITGFTLGTAEEPVDTLTINTSIEGFSTTATAFDDFTFTSTPASLGAALNTVSALSEDNAVVFSFGGNTYLFIENETGASANGAFEATDIVVKLTGSYDLEDLAAAVTIGVAA